MQVGHIGHEEANENVAWPLQGGQDQIDVPQVPLLSHGEALETWNLALS